MYFNHLNQYDECIIKSFLESYIKQIQITEGKVTNNTAVVGDVKIKASMIDASIEFRTKDGYFNTKIELSPFRAYFVENFKRIENKNLTIAWTKCLYFILNLKDEKLAEGYKKDFNHHLKEETNKVISNAKNKYNDYVL